MRDKKLDKFFKKMTVKFKDMEWEINKRDPKRIKRILKLVGEIWIKNPDMRLCQLLGNCFEAGDNYYKEDEDLKKKLKEIYNV